MTKEIGLIGGVEKRLIEIQNYDSDWSKKFEMHADLIRKSLGKAAARVEHIGSTSVPGDGNQQQRIDQIELLFH